MLERLKEEIMSRCILDDEKRGVEVVIGWDPPLDSFLPGLRRAMTRSFGQGTGIKSIGRRKCWWR
jgi:hypothetical protein